MSLDDFVRDCNKMVRKAERKAWFLTWGWWLIPVAVVVVVMFYNL